MTIVTTPEDVLSGKSTVSVEDQQAMEKLLNRPLTEAEVDMINILRTYEYIPPRSAYSSQPPAFIMDGVKNFTLDKDNIETGSSAAIDELKRAIIILLENFKLVPKGLIGISPNKIELGITNNVVEVEIDDRDTVMKFGVDLSKKIEKTAVPQNLKINTSPRA